MDPATRSRRLLQGAWLCALALAGTAAALVLLKASGKADGDVVYVNAPAYVAVVVAGSCGLAVGLAFMRWTAGGSKAAWIQGSAVAAMQVVLALVLAVGVGIEPGGGTTTLGTIQDQEIRAWDLDVVVPASLLAGLPGHEARWPELDMPADLDSIAVRLDWDPAARGAAVLDLDLQVEKDGAWQPGYGGENGLRPGATWSGRVALAGERVRVVLATQEWTLDDQPVHVRLTAYRDVAVTCTYGRGVDPRVGPGTCDPPVPAG